MKSSDSLNEIVLNNWETRGRDMIGTGWTLKPTGWIDPVVPLEHCRLPFFFRTEVPRMEIRIVVPSIRGPLFFLGLDPSSPRAKNNRPSMMNACLNVTTKASPKKKPSPAATTTPSNNTPKSGGDHHVSRGEFLAWLQKGSEKALDVKKAKPNGEDFPGNKKPWVFFPRGKKMSQRFQEEIRCFSRRQEWVISYPPFYSVFWWLLAPDQTF